MMFLSLFVWLACDTESSDLEMEAKPAFQYPDVLLVTIDTLRADRLGCYGDSLAQTPNLDQLALDSIVFSEAQAVAPLTLPSHSSILTGLYPKNHGMRDNAGFRLPDEVQTLAESLKGQGYQTSAFVSAFVLSHSWGLDQGFDLYHDPFHPQDMLSVGAFGEAELPAGEVLNGAKNWWKSADSKRGKFTWVHLYDPHAPWDVPKGWTGDPYRAEIAKVDRLLGSLLKMVDDDTLIIVTSDHGESLWEGGEREHTVLLGHSVTNVPLIIRPPKGVSGEETWTGVLPTLDIQRPEGIDQSLNLEPVRPKIRAGKIVHSPVSGVDIAPTIAYYAGLELQDIDGENLHPLMEGKVQEDRIVYAESVFPFFHFGWHPLTMAQNQDTRLERGVDARFFDPQTLNTAKESQELIAFTEKMFGEELPEPGKVTDKEALALQQLGYLTDPVSVNISDAPDPREKIGVLSELRQTELLATEEAIPLLRKLVEEEPNLIDAKLSLSYRLSATGKIEEALEICTQILQSQPLHSTALNNAILLSTQLGRDQQAIEFAEEMLATNGEDVRPYRYLAAIYMKQGHSNEVIAIGTKGLSKAPEDPNLNYLVGLSHIYVKQYAQAPQFLEQAIKYGSRATDINLWLGIGYQQQGLVDKAVESYEKAAQDLPMDFRPYGLAGVMLAGEGRCDEAKTYLLNVFGRGGQTPDIVGAMEKCGLQ